MRPRVVLVTGASRYLGSRLAGVLAADATVERVIGVDTVSPQPALTAVLGRTEFVRADIRNPLIAKVIAQAEVDTVVHMNVISTPRGAGGRTAMKEINVIGTMQLFAACQKAPSMHRMVVKSTTAIYGSSPRDPALFTEGQEPRTLPRSGYAKDAFEVEGYARGFGRRRPDVALSLLRFTNFIGPSELAAPVPGSGGPGWSSTDATAVETPLTRYLSLPVIPTVLGFDPRLQLCHEDDAIEVLRRMALEDHPGTFNVGGEGVLLLSQAARRLGRPTVPVPSPAVSLVARAFRSARLVDYSPEQMRFLAHGRVVDVSRLRAELGTAPRSTEEAFAAFARTQASHRFVDLVQAAERGALDLLSRGSALTASFDRTTGGARA